MGKHQILIAATAILALGSAPAMADGLSYHYLDVAYQQADLDGIDGGGPQVNAVAAIGNSPAFFEFKYRTLSFSDSGFDLDIDDLEVGLGFVLPVAQSANFDASFGLLRRDASISSAFGSASDDDTGYYARAGLRGMVSSSVELFADLTYFEINDVTDTKLDAGTSINIAHNAALVLAYNTEEDLDGFRAAVRFQF